MAIKPTALLSNVRLLYRNYGSFSDFVKSEYLSYSVVIAALCWRLVSSEAWIETSKTVLPALVGFSIATFAIVFVVLDGEARALLRAPSPKLEDKSPLLMLASTIAHSSFVQVLAVLFAIIYESKPFPSIGYKLIDDTVDYIFGYVGMASLIYGILLVVANILTVYRVIEIQSRIGHKS